MNQEATLVRQQMRTPRAAAIAGIIFSVLLITSLLLIRISIPYDPLGRPTDVVEHSKEISLALNLLPFQASPSCGSWPLCATVWESVKIASLPPYSSAAACSSSG